jgi:transposase
MANPWPWAYSGSTQVNYVINAPLTDAEWYRIEPLLPPQKPRTGRPAHDHRRIISGILWVQRSGYPWRSMPSQFGRWSTAASRYHRWKKDGVWQRVEQALGEASHAPASNGHDTHTGALTEEFAAHTAGP